MNNFNALIGEKVKEIRNEMGISQEEFCKKLNDKITRSNLSKIELGKISPSAEFIKSVIEAFNISPYWLLELENEEITEAEKNVINNYRKLSDRDKIKVETYIDFIILENNQKLSTSEIIEKEKKEKNSTA